MHDLDLELDDLLIFELPTYAALEAFRDRFRPDWDGWTQVDATMWLFALRLDEHDDVGSVLRAAESLVLRLGLPSVRFTLDGRVYALEVPTVRTKIIPSVGGRLT